MIGGEDELEVAEKGKEGKRKSSHCKQAEGGSLHISTSAGQLPQLKMALASKGELKVVPTFIFLHL